MRQILADYPTFLPFVFGIVVGTACALFVLALLRANPRYDEDEAVQPGVRPGSDLPSNPGRHPGRR